MHTTPASTDPLPVSPADTWKALAPRIAARPKLRTWNPDTNKFDITKNLTTRLPQTPAGVLLYHNQRTHVLALDFDTKRHGQHTVDTDFARALTWITEAGGVTVTDQSTSGGRHILVPLAIGTSATLAEITQLMRLLEARLPSLDKTPMTNPKTGCITVPGSPCRQGGHRILDGPLTAAIDAFTTRSHPALLPRLNVLLGALTPTPTNASASPHAPATTGSAAHARLRPEYTRTGDLPERITAYATTGVLPPDGTWASHSEARQAVLAHAVLHGHSLTTIQALMAPGRPWHRGLATAYTRYRHNATNALQRDFTKALNWAATHIPQFRPSRAQDQVHTRGAAKGRGCVTTRPPASRPLTYRGCSVDRRRRGVVRTTPIAEVVAFRRGRRLSGGDLPPASVFVNLELEDDAYAGVPCWSGGPAHWAHVTVATAYDLHYGEIRPQMTSGGIAKHTLIVIAAALARTADAATGRNARPANEQLQRATGFTERTIQRARECLRLLGVATEVLRGRQRTYTERMASWRMGDHHRGWASVWALHDNAQLNRVIHTVSPHLERSPVTTHTSPGERLITTRGRPKGARHGVATRRPAPDAGGWRLAAVWRADPHAPPWARRFTPTSWAAMLAAPAAAGWTPRDLNQLVTDWLGVGRRIPDTPARPIGLLGAMLAWYGIDNLADRPAAADMAREAAELAVHRERRAAAPAEHAAELAAREQGRAALSGTGHAWAAREFARLANQSARRRTQLAAAQAAHDEQAVRSARGLRDAHPL
ncbi:hypothetical protein LAUMK4_04698 [Mycobacterium persicum]|uniref:Plasmid replication protein n=1 Tax=Mycobacterium persicum TaxID=1487726 RepID=A0ABY6RQ02_9MYCO|nr:hypothetical protein [Mycobacterium persicum]VAZ99725.1 hypothetical protein LAUMK4_04698 [Mycobacterium persicum]